MVTCIFRKASLLFESDEDFLELIDDYGFEKAPVLETLGRYIEAGNLRAAAGEAVAAIRLFARGGDHDRAAQCLCDAFWEYLPYNTPVTDQNRTQIRVLEELLPDIAEPSVHLKNEVSPHGLKHQTLTRCSSSICSKPLLNAIHRLLRRLHLLSPMAIAAAPMLLFYDASTIFHCNNKKPTK